jgi:periplasmic divalent cation tolerance protein
MILFVITTLPDESTAAEIIRQLIEKKLTACGTILPGARSIYHWNDAIEDSTEVLVIFKIPKTAATDFESELRALHPYEVPEIAGFEAVQASQAYTAWVLASCKKTV